MVPLENGEFLHLRPKNCDFSVYSNICLFNNFLLKSHNKVPLVLKRPLRSVVYDSAFNLKFPFLVNFGILLPNRIINVNQGVRRFSQYLYVLQPLKVNQIVINKHKLFFKFSSGGFQFLSHCGFKRTSRGFKVYYQKLTIQFLFHQREYHVCFLLGFCDIIFIQIVLMSKKLDSF